MVLSYVALGGAWAPQDAPCFVYPLSRIEDRADAPRLAAEPHGTPPGKPGPRLPSFAGSVSLFDCPCQLPVGLTRCRGQPVASVYSVAFASEVISLAPLSLPAIALSLEGSDERWCTYKWGKGGQKVFPCPVA